MKKALIPFVLISMSFLFAAQVTFQVDATANPNAYSSFGVKGSWDASGNFDSGWSGGTTAMTDSDGDGIWEATIAFVSDGGTNTWEWGVEGDGNWIDGNWQFTVANDDAQTLSFTLPAPGSTNITFRVNSSRVHGIVDSTSGVDLRGTVTQWGAGTNLVSDGGDYWSLTIQLAPGDYEYKYGAQILNLDGTTSDYWENDIPGADYQGSNRSLTVGNDDMVIDMDYLGRGPDNNNPPYTPSDSVDVYFRINMSQHTDFDPGTQSVYVAGSFQGWDPGSSMLTQEGDSDYWNIHIQTHAANHEFKYTLGAWGTDESNNRALTINQDTTIQWVYWNDQGPEPFASNATLTPFTLTTDLSNAVAGNGFVLGDTLIVKYGYGGTAESVTIDTLAQVPFQYTYSLTLDALPVDLEAGLFYQYYRIKNGSEYRETYFNFEHAGSDVSLAERRFHTLYGASDANAYAVNDEVNSNVDRRRMPIFRNTDQIGSELTVTYSVDVRPAYYQVMSGDTLFDIQGTTHVNDADSVLGWGPWINGPGSEPLSGDSWTTWGGTLFSTTEKQMHDDGLNGDAVAGDSVYSIQVTYASTATLGQEFKFGLRGGDNESGYGLNHIENIDVSNPTIASYWGSINPFKYNAWDFDTNTSNLAIDENETGLTPLRFSLSDNYPNPFNPTTSFTFTLPFGAEVSLNVYNLLGVKVATVHNGYAKPGTYDVKWNGKDMTGNKVASGVYIYELDAGAYFYQTKKMTLLK
ncbi:MAG: T9SS type A sorting domain-containing protein [Candidatus Marinimicrobia bacterium]|jgi:hypothetical protein|nr:T9SS type A sorting domain-containing protein [Candidatus Neomarinimicrobiota bacterium]MBT4283228.1 T9SS type A sorting domain-containing protein [Candidatus Neomarinimicrobiota bacterium]MBT4636820.1 T9SS type A sorting domain-containing protein [Candidatus Neomarinimicrobiota bacterium]MBT5069619.1 T9SS type A sorting domain-containing protein [Candidatus Neomarinimicrobiota bacterium]MBT5760765.1 T9SS type A sorting domain-containing protein [Candidatus Neomarinimicrobiota bacterium]